MVSEEEFKTKMLSKPVMTQSEEERDRVKTLRILFNLRPNVFD